MQKPRDPRSLAIAAMLTAVAGFVDAVGYLAYSHIYTANMSGNSVAIGIGFGTGHLTEMLTRTWPVLIYLLGLIFGRLLLQIAARVNFKRAASIAFGIEILALLIIVLFSGHRKDLQWLFVALLAWSMGIQNAALTRFSSLTIHTGFVTGTLLKCAQEFVGALTWFWDEIHTPKPLYIVFYALRRQPSFLLSCFLFSIWCTYVFGAVLGAYMSGVVRSRTLIFAIVPLLLLILSDGKRPLVIADEEQPAQA